MSWYEKYRPVSIDGLIGKTQRQAVKALVGADTVHQRVLFTGPSGTGKTTVARIYAAHLDDGQYKYLNCREIGVQDIREYLSEVRQVRPLFTKYSVVLLDELDALSNAAQQQLLDIEDIPEWVVILAATKDPHKLRADLRSRFLEFNFKTPDRAEIGALLLSIFERENFTPVKEKVTEIINNSDGNLRKIISDAQALAQGVEPSTAVDSESDAFKTLFGYIAFKKGSLTEALNSLSQQENIEGVLIAVCNYAIKNFASNPERYRVILEVFGQGLNPNLPPNIAFANLLMQFSKTSLTK